MQPFQLSSKSIYQEYTEELELNLGYITEIFKNKDSRLLLTNDFAMLHYNLKQHKPSKSARFSCGICGRHNI